VDYKDKLPDYIWVESERDSQIHLRFLYGGHMGGECEIILPRKKIKKFCENSEWRDETMARFYRIVFLGAPEMNIPIRGPEALRDGIVPDDWE